MLGEGFDVEGKLKKLVAKAKAARAAQGLAANASGGQEACCREIAGVR